MRKKASTRKRGKSLAHKRAPFGAQLDSCTRSFSIAVHLHGLCAHGAWALVLPGFGPAQGFPAGCPEERWRGAHGRGHAPGLQVTWDPRGGGGGHVLKRWKAGRVRGLAEGWGCSLGNCALAASCLSVLGAEDCRPGVEASQPQTPRRRLPERPFPFLLWILTELQKA